MACGRRHDEPNSGPNQRHERSFKMPSILIVCTANICRSPVVEAVLRDRLFAIGHADWSVSSAGTLAREGDRPSRFGAEVLAERGLNISAHRSREATREQVRDAELVLCMESAHAEALRVEVPERREHIRLLTEMIDRDEDIADPYGGPKHWYEQMVDQVTGIIERGLPRIVSLVEEEAAQRP